jgi:hypothetical protein
MSVWWLSSSFAKGGNDFFQLLTRFDTGIRVLREHGARMRQFQLREERVSPAFQCRTAL